MRVLIVEDDPLIALDLEEIVRDHGFEPVGPASSKSEALACADGADIALVDVNLADGRTGPDIARALTDGFRIPTLFVTGNPEQIKDLRTGAIGFLTKPHSSGAILEALQYATAHLNGLLQAKTTCVQPLTAGV